METTRIQVLKFDHRELFSPAIKHLNKNITGLTYDEKFNTLKEHVIKNKRKWFPEEGFRPIRIITNGYGTIKRIELKHPSDNIDITDEVKMKLDEEFPK